MCHKAFSGSPQPRNTRPAPGGLAREKAFAGVAREKGEAAVT